MIKDTYRLNGFSSIKFPKLKGHIKLTLHNPTTGKNEVVEGDNIITNAVRDIYANNYMGAIDYSKTMPLWSNWYGGILCYENAFAVDSQTGLPDPDDYFIQGNDVNECVAHAGGSAIPTDHDDDLLRGSPTTSAFQYTDTSVKQVWEWLPSHGNSNKNISALSLTHKDTGDAGTGTSYWAFQNFYPFALIQGSNLSAVTVGTKTKDNVFCFYDENHSLFFHQGEDSEYYSDHTEYGSAHIHFASDKLTLHIRKLPFRKAGLYEVFTASDTERIVTITLPFTIYCIPAYYFDYANKQLWIFSNMTSLRACSNTTVNYCVIDCESEEVIDNGTIVSDTAELTALCCCNNNRQVRRGSEFDFAHIVKDGNYVYFPTGTVAWGDDDSSGAWDPCYVTINGYKKINITNQAEQSKITYNTSLTGHLPLIKAGGLLVSSGRVMNGGVGYTCVNQFPLPNLDAVSYMSYIFAEQDKISTYASAKGSGFYLRSMDRYIVANKLVNTSKWNLPTPVQKTASQSMSIEYTITEVDPNE